MRHSFFAVVIGVFVCCLLSISLSGQQTTSSPALLYLQRSLSQLEGNTSISDVTLTGSAQRVAGSDDETGTATLKAIPGASRIDLNLSSGPRSEIRDVSGTSPAGTWSGPDGVAHAMSFHNLLIDPAWFFPAFPITHGVSAGYLATYVGHETRDGQAVEHVAISETFAVRSPAAEPIMAHLSQMDFFLDSTTFLPTAVTFNIHPDNNASLDIPIEVRFSDYRAVNGVQVPFHVQKFLNNGLILDLQFETAALNTGLAASLFQVQ
jgi:hypothetical protein